MKNAYYILIALIIIPWIFILIHIISKKKRIARFYKQLTEKYGFTPGEAKEKKSKYLPLLSGAYRNRIVTVESLRKETGGKKSDCTLVRVNINNNNNFEFLITLNTKQNRLKYQNSEKTGDAEFDEKFILVSNNPELARQVLNFNTKFKLQQAADLNFKGEVKLNGNIIDYEEPGLINSSASLMRTELLLHELCDIADELKYA